VTRALSAADDLGRWGPFLVLATIGVFLVLLVVEVVRARRLGKRVGMVLASGLLGASALAGAILRPAMVESSGVTTTARVLVLVDDSRSMRLPADDGGTRVDVARGALASLREAAREARLSTARFGRGAPQPFEELSASQLASDLTAALAGASAAGEEPPAAVVVISDGALDRPAREQSEDRGALELGSWEVPVHTVRVAERSPRDASVRRVEVAGAAIAHQPFGVRVEVGCAGGLRCGRVPIVVGELQDTGPPTELARGDVVVPDEGSATVELPITLHRAGSRVIEVKVDAPRGDAIPENDQRLAAIEVARDRVRILHIAGRPTYDVRALRNWLKADASIDVVAFFILRTPTSNVGATGQELALIPFPVDELFTTHLDSFDAVVLQDFHATMYGLEKHLGNLASYVKRGGGLILVGGPDSFGPGRYAGTAISPVLPVRLERGAERKGVDLALFTPTVTAAGRRAPVLGPLRRVVGDDLPDMPGTNVVGAPSPGATILWTHPTLGEETRMPVLALGEFGTGRVIALTVDGTHKLLFSTYAAKEAGRAYGALWEGLLGWLMRDPRFESLGIHMEGGCVAGEPSALSVHALPGHAGTAKLEVVRLGSPAPVFSGEKPVDDEGSPVVFELLFLEAGGYSAEVHILFRDAEEDAAQPATRRDFACERGGDEWADSRPDPERLRAIAKSTGGVALDAASVKDLPMPAQTFVATRRSPSPVLPAWVWSTLAAAFVGGHWLARRRSGFA
jgi:uncharacterized membrane protein